MRHTIPAPLLAVCSDFLATYETHASLDSLFTYAGAPGEPPEGSKPVKALAWLRLVNKDESLNPLEVLGRIMENHMEEELDSSHPWDSTRPIKLTDREKIEKTLARNNLTYVKGGKIVPFQSLAAPSKSLEELIKDQDISAVNEEFDRALKNVESNPREAVSAASNILESLCKAYIEETPSIQAPAKLDLKSVWAVVRKDLGFDPSLIEDHDLQKILSGLISLVDGVASLRTHASSAHGAGKKSYKLEPRHARLAVHAAHTAAMFVFETWKKKKKT